MEAGDFSIGESWFKMVCICCLLRCLQCFFLPLLRKDGKKLTLGECMIDDGTRLCIPGAFDLLEKVQKRKTTILQVFLSLLLYFIFFFVFSVAFD